MNAKKAAVSLCKWYGKGLDAITGDNAAGLMDCTRKRHHEVKRNSDKNLFVKVNRTGVYPELLLQTHRGSVESAGFCSSK